MKQTTGRVKSLQEILFLVLFVANNFVAFYFFTIILLFQAFPANKYSPIEIYLRLASTGFIVSLFFSVISSAISYLFKKYFLPALTGQVKFFSIQFGFLFLLYLVALFTIIILPDLKS